MNKIITLTLTLLFSFSLMAQNDSITISGKNITINQAFQQLEQQSKYTVAYSQTKFNANKIISLNLKKQKLNLILWEILKETGFTYKLNGTHIIIVPIIKENEKQKTLPRQIIRGTVTDGASGKPIAHASIILLNQSPQQGTTTDSLGRFRFNNLPIGRYNIQISCLGYEPFTVREILLISSKEAFQEINLKENSQNIEVVVVRPNVNKQRPLNPMALAGGRMFSVEETSRFAGGFDDPARLIASFAGVAGNFESNGIAIRGNSPQSLQWRFEGVEIPNPTHYSDMGVIGGGIFTALSSQVLGNSDFFNGAFPAEYSNALSGVFDMNMRTGNNERYEHAIQIGSIGIDLASEGPLSKNKKSSYLFNYRYSTTELVSPDLGLNFQDLSFKLNFPTHKVGTFSVWGIGLIDKHETEAEDPENWETYFDREEDHTSLIKSAAGLSHKYLFNNDMYIKTVLAASYSKVDYVLDQYVNPDKKTPVRVSDLQSSNWDIVFNSYLNKKFGSRHVNRTGITITKLLYDLDYKESPALGLNAPAEQISRGKDNTAVISVFSNSVFSLSPALTANIGITAQLFMLNNNWTVEPRVSLKWDFAPDHSLALAYGLHSRREKLDYYFVKNTITGEHTVNKDLDFAKAHHIVLTHDWSISPYLHLKIEPYFQYLFDVPVEQGTPFSIINHQDYYLDKSLVNKGKGRNYGIDITLEHYLNRGYYYLFTGSLFDSRYTEGDDEWRNTRYNRNYLFNALGGKEWLCGTKKQNIFGTNLRFSYQGGDRYTPVNETLTAERHEIVLDDTRAFTKQFPAQLTVDLSINYKINRKSVSHEFGIKILNLFGNLEHHTYEFNEIEKSIQKSSVKGMLPNISYKLQF